MTLGRWGDDQEIWDAVMRSANTIRIACESKLIGDDRLVYFAQAALARELGLDDVPEHEFSTFDFMSGVALGVAVRLHTHCCSEHPPKEGSKQKPWLKRMLRVPRIADRRT